jgi:hypothetical protein
MNTCRDPFDDAYHQETCDVMKWHVHVNFPGSFQDSQELTSLERSSWIDKKQKGG